MVADRATGGDGAQNFSPQVLSQYGFLADGERGVLVGPHGDFAWMCVPRWDSDAIFSSLIGGGGLYAITPTDGRYVCGGYYESGSLIWRSRWRTATGVIECRQALAYPAQPNTAIVLRRIQAIKGEACVRAVLDVRAGFAQCEMTDISCNQGVLMARSGSLRLRWSNVEGVLPTDGGALILDLRVSEGGHYDLILEVGDQEFTDPTVSADAAWASTQAQWKSVVPEFSDTLAPRDARHSYAVLRGLTSAGGGMVAAATMSLPERAGTGRNYDYRYAWIRDQCYAGQAVAVAQPHPLLDEAVNFIAQRLLADGPQLKPAYTVDGGSVPDERQLTHLVGYPGGSDKVGNWVNKPFQLDALGETLLLFGTASRHDRLEAEHWRAVETAVEAIATRWNEADAGIWELDNEHWAHSRLMCVAGLRSIAGSAPLKQASAWDSLAETIAAATEADCVHSSGRWQRSPGDERVDAALLLPAIRGAVSASDPRTSATISAVAKDLSRDGYIYRFRQDQLPLGEAEGAFVLCGFLMALAVHQQGRPLEAITWFERNRAACGPPGLLTEEFDVEQRLLRGNVPQAFVHALLLECATRLAGD